MKKLLLLLFLFCTVIKFALGQQPKLMLPIGHYLEITSVAFSPDGKKIVTASEDNTARVWDLASGKLLVELLGHEAPVLSALFSTDGKKIITASGDATAKVWDARTGLVMATMSGHFKTIYHASFSPDGKKIITASEDTTVKIWNASSGTLLLDLEGYVEGVFSAAPAKFSADGKRIVTISGDSTVKIWDAVSGGLLSEKPRADEIFFNVTTSGLSPNGKKAFTSKSKTVQISDVATGKLLAEMKGHADFISDARFSSNGKYIFTTNFYTPAKTWDAGTGQLLADLSSQQENSYEEGNSAAFSPDETKIVTWAPGSETARIREVVTGTELAELKGHDDEITAARFSPDGKKIITASLDGTAKIWDAASGTVLLDLKEKRFGLQTAAFNKDGSKVIATTFLGDTKIWDVGTGKLINDLDGHTGDARYAAFPAVFSPQGKKIVTPGDNYKAKIWNAATGKLLVTLKGHKEYIRNAHFNSEGNKIVTASYDKTVKIWDTGTGKLLITLNGSDDEFFYDASFSPDDKKIVTASKEHEAKIWNAITGKLITVLKGHNGSVMSATFSPDGKKIITASLDNTCKIWNAETGQLIYTFFAVDSNDYLAQIPAGYYQTTTAASKLLHYVTNDLQIISFEQLDVKYNRPDKVLEALGNTDTALIKSYRKAWEKRIQKLGIDTTAFRDDFIVPAADFANRESIEFKQKNETLQLHIKGNDSTYTLDRFNIWVNEVPVYGQKGVSIKKKKKIDTIISVQLSRGENRIETSITNVNGTESYRMPLLVNYTPVVKQREKNYFVGIGIDTFSDSQYDLRYSTKDIRDLAIKLKEKYGSTIIIDTLFNQNVTISNVKALKEKLLQSTVNDKVIISYSGHGLLSKDYDYYLSTYAVNFKNPAENGLPYDELENLLDSIPARKKLMLIDACHSGEVDKEEGIAMNKMADSLGLTKGIIIDDSVTTNLQLGLKNSFELMQSLFVNVGKSTGATIISAAAGNQFALERGDLKNGVFTYSLLEAMEKNKTIKISQLKKIVGERVEELTNGMQKPTSRNETIVVDWSL